MGLTYGTYQGRRVPLEKIMRGDRKKFKVYVISPSTGRVKRVDFGDRDYKIKRDIPARRESYRKRHHCDDPSVDKPKDKAEYWSCKTWQKGISVGELLANPAWLKCKAVRVVGDRLEILK